MISILKRKMKKRRKQRENLTMVSLQLSKPYFFPSQTFFSFPKLFHTFSPIIFHFPQISFFFVSKPSWITHFYCCSFLIFCYSLFFSLPFLFFCPLILLNKRQNKPIMTIRKRMGKKTSKKEKNQKHMHWTRGNWKITSSRDLNFLVTE